METRYGAQAAEPHLSQVAMQKITTEKQSLEVANAKLRVAVWLKGVTRDLLFSAVLYSNGFVAQHNCRHEH